MIKLVSYSENNSLVMTRFHVHIKAIIIMLILHVNIILDLRLHLAEA